MSVENHQNHQNWSDDFDLIKTKEVKDNDSDENQFLNGAFKTMSSSGNSLKEKNEVTRALTISLNGVKTSHIEEKFQKP